MGSADEVNIQAAELNRTMKVRRPLRAAQGCVGVGRNRGRRGQARGRWQEAAPAAAGMCERSMGVAARHAARSVSCQPPGALTFSSLGHSLLPWSHRLCTRCTCGTMQLKRECAQRSARGGPH